MRNLLTILAIWAAGLGSAAQFGKISILYDTVLVARYGDQGTVALGLMVSIVGMVGLIFGTTAGILVARIGPRRAIVAALALGAAVSLGQAVLPPYPVMMALRVLEGVSHLAIVVVGPTAIATVAGPRHLGAAMTLWSSFFGLTYAILALFAPPFVAANGAGALFVAHGVWMVAMAVVLARMLPPDPVAPPARAEGLLAQHRAIYASPFTAAPAMGFVCYTVLYVALLTLLPPLFPEDLRARVAFGLPLISIGVSLTLGVWLLGHASPVRVVQGGFLAALAGLAIFGTGLGHPLTMEVGAVILFAALGLVQGASFAAIPALNPTPPDRARAAGAIAQLGNLGTTTGTPVLAALMAALGPIGIVVFTAPFCVAGIGLHVWQAARRSRAR